MKAKNLFLSTFFTFLSLGNCQSQTISPFQSSARPYNLDIVNPVMLSGSDEQSKTFNSDILPEIQKIQRTIFESRNNVSRGNTDFSKLTLDKDYSVRVYFVGDGASWKNSLGVYTNGEGTVQDVLKTDAKLIFPDVSTNNNVRSNGNPLGVGDFVDLGQYKAGEKLDFFLIARGATNPSQIYSTDMSLNRDGMVHALNFSNRGSSYLLIGFEDIHGLGDRDYNDALIAVEYKWLNAPEPSLAMMGAFCLSVLTFKRNRL